MLSDNYLFIRRYGRSLFQAAYIWLEELIFFLSVQSFRKDCFRTGKSAPRKRQQVKLLQDGSFVNRCENPLAFGNPDSDKKRLLCGLLGSPKY